MDRKADIAVIGLAVMGQNLILNMNDHGYTVAAFNRTVQKVDDFLGHAAKGTNVIGTHSGRELAEVLKKPRKIMLMVKAGEAVDNTIGEIIPFLEKGDLIIDGGNSHYSDSARRAKDIESRGLLYIGTGVSGGEAGARSGPSIMPGGSKAAWPLVEDIFKTIAAKTPDGSPCCEWVGNDGAGHYVKMAHNGIEYGDMQIISEGYHLLREGLGLGAKEMSAIFDQWNNTALNSYLIEITRDILAARDSNGRLIVDTILDKAGQKGTGKWFSANSLDLGIPVTLITEAVYARCLSSLKDERVAASKILKGPTDRYSGDTQTFIDDLGKALLCAKIVSYAQGFMLMRAAAYKFGWELDYGQIAMLWRGGCIIRSAFLDKIKQAYDTNPGLNNLLLDSYFASIIGNSQKAWRNVVAQAVILGIPLPSISSALAFYDGYRTANLPANLIQAQRDYFGAHTYERTDKPSGEFFHTNWTGTGGDAASGTYAA